MRNRLHASLLLVIVIGVTVFAWIATKATVSSFTHDESFSYLQYVPDHFMDIISNQRAYSNNHVLNTLGMKYSSMVFGSSELALRLPNLLMLLVFFTYAFLLMRDVNPLVRVSVFVLLATNTALIDFFGLARGYGMSIGFMIMGIYHLFRSFDENKTRHLVMFNLAALLAILANFTMVNFYLSALVVYNLMQIAESRVVLKEKFRFWRVNRVNIMLMGVLLFILYEPVRKAVKFNSFDFGGKQGFVTDTVSSLIFHGFTNIHFSTLVLTLLQITLVVVVIIPVFIIVVKFLRSDPEFFRRFRALVLVSLVLVAISLETVLQHYFMKTDYLVGRFSLFLFPLLVLNAGLLMDYGSTLRCRGVFLSFAVLLAMLSASNFYVNRNLHTCAEWSYDSGTKDAISALADYHQAHGNLKQDSILLGVNWLFEPTVNFYRETRKLTWLIPVDRKDHSADADFLYLSKDDSGLIRDRSQVVVFSSPEANTILLKVR
jgi:hypothetical protein